MDVKQEKSHTLIGFANPFLRCSICKNRVTYWHDDKRCGCNKDYFNYPCNHKGTVNSICPTWNPVDGCTCTTPCKK